jgi:hypothetical protein
MKVYSYEEPYWPPYCECKYDPVNDTMDREDCLLHCGLEETPVLEDALPQLQTGIKKPIGIVKPKEENAA